MNRLFICLLILFSAQKAFSQNYIFLTNGGRIVIDSIHQPGSDAVTYYTIGNRHEIKINQLNYIRLGDTLLTFDKNNKPIYRNDKIPAVVAAPGKPAEKPVEKPAENKIVKPAEPVKVPAPAPRVIKAPEPVVTSMGDSSYNKPDVNLVFFPMTLIEPDMALRVGAEFQLTSGTSIQADVAYIFGNWDNMLNSNNVGTGMALRLEYRNYSIKNNNHSFYVAPQGMFKFKNVDDNNLSFNNPSIKYIGAANLKFGFVTSTTSPFYIDLYSGFGLRYETSSGIFSGLTGNRILPNLLFGFNAGIRLNKL